MGKNINVCQFEGNIGSDLTPRYTPANKMVLNFSIACSNDYFDKTKNDWVNRADWVDCVAFDKVAEKINSQMEKGMGILILDARYQKRKWQDKDGQDRYAHEFIVNEWRPLAKLSSGAPQSQQGGMPNSDNGFSDSIPF